MNFAGNLPEEIFKNVVIIPVPLSKNRLKERGFNQSELIGGIISQKLGKPLSADIILRTKAQKPQSEIKNREERFLNVKDSFMPAGEKFPVGQTALLIDDVTTSGATLYEAALAVKNAGAKKIIALTAARA